MPAPSILPLVNAAALALAIVCVTLSWVLVVVLRDHLPDRRRSAGSRTPVATSPHSRWITAPLVRIRFAPIVGTGDVTNGLAARYSAAFAAYLADRSERVARRRVRPRARGRQGAS